MRIISSFRDYYDIATQDNSGEIIYVREERTIDKKEIPKTLISLAEKIPVINGISRGIIGFCGELYPFFAGRSGGEPLDPYVYLFDFASISKILAQAIKDRRWWSFPGTEFSKKTWNECLHIMHRAGGSYFFLQLDTPVFRLDYNLHDSSTLTINPRLNKIGFQRVKNPYDAYQEIEMYLSNDLAKQKDNIPTIPDELKAQAHGFDHWSFRKMGKNSK